MAQLLLFSDTAEGEAFLRAAGGVMEQGATGSVWLTTASKIEPFKQVVVEEMQDSGAELRLPVVGAVEAVP